MLRPSFSNRSAAVGAADFDWKSPFLRLCTGPALVKSGVVKMQMIERSMLEADLVFFKDSDPFERRSM